MIPREIKMRTFTIFNSITLESWRALATFSVVILKNKDWTDFQHRRHQKFACGQTRTKKRENKYDNLGKTMEKETLTISKMWEMETIVLQGASNSQCRQNMSFHPVILSNSLHYLFHILILQKLSQTGKKKKIWYKRQTMWDRKSMTRCVLNVLCLRNY